MIPRHVAVIMDGNGRWAKKRLLPRNAGHRAGMKRMISLSEHIFDCGVEFCTLYALSTENLKRPPEELEGLFELFREYFIKNTQTLKEKGIVLRVIGNLQLLPPDVREIIQKGETETKGGTRGTAGDYCRRQPRGERGRGNDGRSVFFAAFYGGRSRSRPFDQDRQGDKALELFALAVGVCRAVFYR